MTPDQLKDALHAAQIALDAAIISYKAEQEARLEAERRIAKLEDALHRIISDRVEEEGTCLHGTERHCTCSECLARGALQASERRSPK